jgi:outer membrane lipoprotein SlyB
MNRIQRALPALLLGFALAAPPVLADDCKNCGIVKSVNVVESKGQGSGAGAVTGGVLGGVLGHQLGGGVGKTVATVAGAAGGAYVGNEVEKDVRSHTAWKVTVEMDYGEKRSFTLKTQPDFAQGDRVRLENGKPVRVTK